MTERESTMDDEWLRTRLAAVPIDDDGFSANVVRRVQRRTVGQRAVLFGAAAVGGALALVAARYLPAIGPVDWAALARMASPGSVTDWLLAHRSLTLAGLAAILAATTVTVLEN